MILGIIGGLLSMAFLYALSMWFYFLFRRKYAGAKYKIEVIAIIIAIMLSVAVKMIITVMAGVNTFGEVFASMLLSIYSGFGGLAFEGLEPLAAEVSSLLKCLYIGSSLYAGLMFVSVMAAKASYEIYSRIVLAFGKQRYTDVYVFTALTPDALALGVSIKKHYCNKNVEIKKGMKNGFFKLLFFLGLSRKKKKYMIIFGGNEIPNYNRHNELCRLVMAEGFLYWSYVGSDKKSIAKRLHLNNHNKGNYDIRFVVFSLAIDGNGLPEEEKNIEIGYSDITIRIEKQDDLRIEYYILAKREMNYQAHERFGRELLYRYVYQCNGINTNTDIKLSKSELDGDFKTYIMSSKEEQAKLDNLGGARYKIYKKALSRYKNEFSSRVVFDFWNEASVGARITVNAIINRIAHEYVRREDKDIYVWSLGFGETSQTIIKQLFTQTAFIDSELSSPQFLVEAFDPNMKELSGLFQYSHPLFACVNNIDETIKGELKRIRALLYANITTDDVKQLKEENIGDIQEIIEIIEPPLRRYIKKQMALLRLNEIKNSYGNRFNPKTMINPDSAAELVVKPTGTKKNLYRQYEGCADEISFPVFLCNTISCLDFGFFESLDMVTGFNNAGYEQVKKLTDKLVNLFVKNSSAYAKSFMDLIHNLNENDYRPQKPDIVIIATGDDFRNIQIANALISDIQNENKNNKEKESKTNDKNQVLIVNIRNKQNQSLLINANGYWDKNMLELDGLSVIISGSSEELYSFESILDHSEDTNYHFGYGCLSAGRETFGELAKSYYYSIEDALRIGPRAGMCNIDARSIYNIVRWVKNFWNLININEPDKNPAAINQIMDQINTSIKQYSGAAFGHYDISFIETYTKRFLNRKEISESEWMGLDSWKKESNRNARMYGAVIKELYEYLIDGEKHDAKFLAEVYATLCMAEHLRWTRLHMAHGWVYQGQENMIQKRQDELLKRHNCLTPYCLVPNNTVMYDLMNVIWAIRDSKIK